MRKTISVAKSVWDLHSVEFCLDLGSGGDGTVELDQRLGKIIGDLDVLEPIERRDSELGNGDVCKGIKFVDRVNGSLDSVVDGSDIVLDGRPEITKSGLDEVGDLWQQG